MAITKRTHSNPCFWTAHWNEDYYKRVVNGEKIPSARTQKVYSLNVKADKIIQTAVDNIHFDKWLGVAEVAPDEMKSFCKKYHPDYYKQFVKDMESHPETVFVDVENLWETLEASAAYQTLLEVIKKQRLDGKAKVELACFVAIQLLRSHAVIHSMIEFAQQTGIAESKFEYYYQLKYFVLGNPVFLYHQVEPIFQSQWIVYVTDKHTFPLPDSPILVRNQNIMIALSPRMLLEVDPKVKADEFSWIRKDGVPKSKLNEYRNRCISNTFKEIIFSDKDVLEDWRERPEFRQRVKLIANKESFNALVEKESNREIWKVNAFGNLTSGSVRKDWMQFKQPKKKNRSR